MRLALGLLMLKPAPCSPSLKSRVAPWSRLALAGSTTTLTGPKADFRSSSADVGIEEHLVAEARAAARAHRHAQGQLGVALLLDQLGDLGRGGVGEDDGSVGVTSVWVVLTGPPG